VAVASDVANAVETAVEALALTGVAAGQVVRRKIPAVPEDATLPQVVVSVGEEGDIEFADFEGSVFVGYPVAVTIVTAGGAKLADDDTIRTWRESIRRKCHDRAAYAGVTGFLEVKAQGRVPFDEGALSKDFNFSIVAVFTVTCLESRAP
jgi:hypothetical protein